LREDPNPELEKMKMVVTQAEAPEGKARAMGGTKTKSAAMETERVTTMQLMMRGTLSASGKEGDQEKTRERRVRRRGRKENWENEGCENSISSSCMRATLLRAAYLQST
jgi:hypothetical protein